MHPPDCCNWEYADDASNITRLKSQCIQELQKVQSNLSLLDVVLGDTRDAHKAFYADTTPSGQSYLAGNYRGSQFRCLECRLVFIGRFQGTLPHLVDAEMLAFHTQLSQAVSALELIPSVQKKHPQFLLFLATTVAEAYVKFLSIHPYANGNGHISRWLVWLILMKLKRYPKSWPLHERPSVDELILRYRTSDKEPLIKFILRAIKY